MTTEQTGVQIDLPKRHLRVVIAVALATEISREDLAKLVSIKESIVDNILTDLVGFCVLQRSPDGLLSVRPSSDWDPAIQTAPVL